ncbi:LRP2-binding protein-like [Amphiura filiformis]|uniref:LRP2-binding protein-like n=1 Tax=Amphiura filiformis TaxID=82378 RepID=UPI003B220F4D
MEHKLSEHSLPHEPLPRSPSIESSISQTKSLHIIDDEITRVKDDQELNEKVENLLKKKIQEGDKNALFQLAQFYFEQELYDHALVYFQRASDNGDYQAKYQLGIMYYDGLGGKEHHKKGFDNMFQVATATSNHVRHIIPCAQYNIGRAYFEGYGVKQSNDEAEKWWLLAADDGNPKASIKAQTALGMYYSREETLDLKKAFFWHSEATGNGSLESQGVLGVMYTTGQGCRQNSDSAFECLKEASLRGNIYAMGNLVTYYYGKKLYTKAAELALKVTQIEKIEDISKTTDCLPAFIAKGIALGYFYYARCLDLGQGVKQDNQLAKKYYSKAFEYDGATAQRLQNMVTHGKV